MKKAILLSGALLALSLSACAYQSKLDAKLEGKNPTERQTVLIDECRKESGPPTVNSARGQRDMTELCDAMIKEMRR